MALSRPPRGRFPFTEDYNGRTQEGVAYSQMTRRGRLRGSTARTFLAAGPAPQQSARSRPTRWSPDCCSTANAHGVAFRQNGVDRPQMAAREVILCGGAVNSPHVLQISGIGPAAHLQSIGVPVLHDLPGVGANLNDHYVVRISHRVRGSEHQPAGARAASGARGRALGDGRQRRADLRRHLGDGLLPQPRGAGQPRPAIAVHAGELCKGRLRQLEREPA